MDQQKIGRFLRLLRKEKGLNQEQFAEIFNVSSRTVSRWENGNNMPDLVILIEISDYYEIDLRELLDGERKSENMNKEMEETVLKAVEYTNAETSKYTQRVNWLLLVGVIFWFTSQIISHTDLVESYAFMAISEFMSGAGSGLVIVGILVTTCHGQKLKAFKQRLLKKQ